MNFPNVKVQPHWLATLERAAEAMHNHYWVCSALVSGVEPEIEEEVRTAISKAIAPFTTVKSWLIYEVGKELATGEVVRGYRKTWLNHMVEQCRTMQETE